MDCPNCGLVNHPSAVRCDCGYDFFDKAVKNTFLTPKNEVTNAQKTIEINDEGYLNEIRAAFEATDSGVIVERIKSGNLTEGAHTIALHELSKRKIDVTDLPKTPKGEHESLDAELPKAPKGEYESLDAEEEGFIFRAWAGKEKLGKVFWIYYWFSIFPLSLTKKIVWIQSTSIGIRLTALSLLILFTPLLIFMWISIWRCAHNTTNRIWELMARLCVIFLPVSLLIIFIKLAKSIV